MGEETRKKLHRIFDLILDINKVNDACFSFSGHADCIYAHIYQPKWEESTDPSWGDNCYMRSEDKLDDIIRQLEEIKEGLQDDV